MPISLTPELDRLVQEKLASGKYGSKEAVLLAALRALDEQKQVSRAISQDETAIVEEAKRRLAPQQRRYTTSEVVEHLKTLEKE